MRNLLIILLLVCVVPSSAIAQKKKKYEIEAEQTILICDSLKQYYTETETGIEFSRVIQTPNLNKEELYNKCLELLAIAYKDSKEVIQNKDKEAGLIFGKGVFVSDYTSGWGVRTYKKCEHTIKIEVREGRFKITLSIDNIYILISGGGIFSEYNNPIKSYYPFWKDCPVKKIKDSFDFPSFVYYDATGIIDYFEDKVNIVTNEEDW